jgi:hypothetical protein
MSWVGVWLLAAAVAVVVCCLSLFDLATLAAEEDVLVEFWLLNSLSVLVVHWVVLVAHLEEGEEEEEEEGLCCQVSWSIVRGSFLMRDLSLGFFWKWRALLHSAQPFFLFFGLGFRRRERERESRAQERKLQIFEEESWGGNNNNKKVFLLRSSVTRS